MARLLFFTGPQLDNAPQADWSREFEGLKKVLENQSCIRLEPPTFSGKRSDFVRILSGKTAPDLLHFSGHGRNKSLLLLNEANQQSILEEDEAGSLFAHCPQIGVVLNACSSAGVAESISGSVLFAIGYQGRLQDEVAIGFTKSFYRSLCSGKMLADAFEIAVLEAGGSGLHMDTKPILFCNSKLDPKSYQVGLVPNRHSTTGQIPDQGAYMASQNSSKSSGGGKRQDLQTDLEKPAVLNNAQANTNSGLIAGNINITGPVTINNYPKSHTSTSVQNNVDPPSFPNATLPTVNTPVGVSGEQTQTEALSQQSRSLFPMPMTDDDWTRLKQLQSRLMVYPATRENMLFEIVGQKANNDPFASILMIPGNSDFFQSLDNLWKTYDDNKLIEKYIQTLKPLTINGEDQLWIDELIERLGRVPPPPRETDILLNAVNGILKRNSILGEKLLEAMRYVRSTKIPRGVQNDQEMVAQFLTHDFPLMCLRSTLDACVNRQIRFEDPSTRKDLIVMKDMFTVASFPGDDKNKLVGAMQAVWTRAQTKDGAELKTSDKSFAEDMLISTWMQVSEQPLEDWEILQLLHRDPNYPVNAKERNSMMFRRVHVLSQPAVQPTGDALIQEYAQSCICEATGIPQNPENPIKAFNDFLEELAEDQAIAALFITKEFTDTIGVLKKYFPRLILVILSTTDADRYSSIYREISFIDNNIARICRS